jgi:hypothetical protein
LTLLAFDLGHRRFHGWLAKPILDRRHDARNGLVGLRQRTGIGIGLDAALAIFARAASSSVHEAPCCIDRCCPSTWQRGQVT